MILRLVQSQLNLCSVSTKLLFVPIRSSLISLFTRRWCCIIMLMWIILVVSTVINNGNWTEWSAIWSEIIRVISKLNERAARVQFEITSMISDQNCTTRSSIATLLDPFWNRTIYLIALNFRFWCIVPSASLLKIAETETSHLVRKRCHVTKLVQA